MINKQDLLKKITITIDIVSNIFAFYAAYIIKIDILPERYSDLLITQEFWIIFLLIPFFYYFWAVNFNIYHTRYIFFKDIFLNAGKTISVVFLSIVLVLFTFKLQTLSRIFLVLYFILSMAFVITG